MRRNVLAAALTAALAVVMLRGAAPVAADDSTGDVDVDAAALSASLGTTPTVPLVGGAGTYSLASATCAVVSADAPATGESEGPLPGTLDAEATTGCHLSASGSYASLACGTTQFTGSGTLQENTTSDTYSITPLDIAVFAGVGIFVGAAAESETGEVTSGAVPIYGVVTLAADLPVAGACASHFLAAVAVFTTA
jgi:hypothetical protein